MTPTQDPDPLLAEVGSNGVAEFDFGRLEISNATAVFELPQVCPGAAVVVRPATENKQFAAGMLRLSGQRQRNIAQSGRITVDDAKQDRLDDRKLYHKHIVVKLVGIKNKAGEVVESTQANIKAFLDALPDWLFDKIRIFCLRPDNFVQGEDELEPDVETLSKNS